MQLNSETARAASEAKSIYELVSILTTSNSINLVRFPGGYEAESPNNALFNKARGKSGKGKGKGVGNNLSRKITGLSFHELGGKGTVLLTILDKSHGKEKGVGFEYATRTVADMVDTARTLEYLEVCDNFGKWNKISLAGLPVFPEFNGDNEEEKVLADNLVTLLLMGQKIHRLGDKVQAIKSKVRKAKQDEVENGELTAKYYAPKGSSTVIVDKDGNPVKRISRSTVNRVRLWKDVANMGDSELFKAEWLQEKGRYEGTLKTDAEMLPLYMEELEKLRAEYVELNYMVRPLELGLIERNMSEDFVLIAGLYFEIQHSVDKEYDLPVNTPEKLKTGEYSEKKVPSKKGWWELIKEEVKEEVTA